MEPREAAIVERVLAGEADAFRELVEAHGRALHRLAYRMTGSAETAEDVVQEALLRAYRGLESFTGGSGLGTWLHRIAANLALDHLRKRKRERQRFVPLETDDGRTEQAPSDAPGPDRLTLSREVDRQVEDALNALSPMERTAFVLRHFEHQTSAEIGNALGTREVTARQAVFRAVHKLRKILGPNLETHHATAR